jgi:hypothetical protein
MAHLENRGTWRGHVGWLVGQLIVVFAGVSAAFVVENYRDSKNQQAEFRQALSGVIAELNRYETRGLEFADGIDAKIAAWQQADRSGRRAIPGYYRIPGATHPPSAAWTTIVSSGLVRLIEPSLRTELGLFYSEVVGIHDNYDRYNQFTEREVLPRIALGPDAFYCQPFVCTWICRKNLPLICVSFPIRRMTFDADLKAFEVQSRRARQLTKPCSKPRDTMTSVPSAFAIHTSCFMDSFTGVAVADLLYR